MDALAVDPEPDLLVRVDGSRMLHAGNDLGTSEVGKQQTFVAEHLGEIDWRLEVGAQLGAGAVSFGNDVLGTNAQGDRGPGCREIKASGGDRQVDAIGPDR